MPTKKPRVTIFPDNLPSKIDLEEACPSVHSAERVFRDRPEVYRECVQRLSEGASLYSIQRTLRVSWNTVAAIRTRETVVVEATKKHIRGLLGVAAQLALERLIEKLENDEIPAGVLPVATGILIDKHRQAEGEPSQTIEVKKSLSLEDVRSELAEIRKGAELGEK